MTIRSQLQGQPRCLTAFPLNPLSGNLSQWRSYIALQYSARGESIILTCSLVRQDSLAYAKGCIGCPQGLNREVRIALKHFKAKPALLPQL